MNDLKTNQPFITVIMPIRNEAEFIEQSIISILNNNYPKEKLEVLVVDGMSTDGTRDIVKQISLKQTSVKLLDNPKKIVPCAMNIGFLCMKGDFFVRIDGHVEVPSDFLRKSIECIFEKPEAWIVGGYIETVSDGFIGKAISAAMQSPVGVGNAMFRRGDYEGWVDTIAFGMHHRWVIDKVGLFDEQLVRNQDDDFNFRVLQAGGKIWLSKDIKSTYYSRNSLKKLWRQYFQYGFWRIRTIQKHRRPATVRQIAPLLLVLSLLVLGMLAFFHTVFQWLLAAEAMIYVFGLVVGMFDVARRSSWKEALLSPLVFMILHFAYGLGSLWGFVRFVLLKGRGLPKPEEHKLSR